MNRPSIAAAASSSRPGGRWCNCGGGGCVGGKAGPQDCPRINQGRVGRLLQNQQPPSRNLTVGEANLGAVATMNVAGSRSTVSKSAACLAVSTSRISKGWGRSASSGERRQQGTEQQHRVALGKPGLRSGGEATKASSQATSLPARQHAAGDGAARRRHPCSPEPAHHHHSNSSVKVPWARSNAVPAWPMVPPPP